MKTVLWVIAFCLALIHRELANQEYINSLVGVMLVVTFIISIFLDILNLRYVILNDNTLPK